MTTLQLQVDQMCELSGGPCVYIGRDIKTSHSGLGITADECAANMKYAETALLAHNIGDGERAEFLAPFQRYRDEIVESG